MSINPNSLAQKPILTTNVTHEKSNLDEKDTDNEIHYFHADKVVANPVPNSSNDSNLAKQANAKSEPLCSTNEQTDEKKSEEKINHSVVKTGDDITIKYSEEEIKNINQKYSQIRTSRVIMNNNCGIPFVHIHYDGYIQYSHNTIKGRFNLILTPNDTFTAQMQIKHNVYYINKYILCKHRSGIISMKFPIIHQNDSNRNCELSIDYPNKHTLGKNTFTLYFGTHVNKEHIIKELIKIEKYMQSVIPQNGIPDKDNDNIISGCKCVSYRNINEADAINLQEYDIDEKKLQSNMHDMELPLKYIKMFNDAITKSQITNRNKLIKYYIIKFINYLDQTNNNVVKDKFISIVEASSTKKL